MRGDGHKLCQERLVQKSGDALSQAAQGGGVSLSMWVFCRDLALGDVVGGHGGAG